MLGWTLYKLFELQLQDLLLVRPATAIILRAPCVLQRQRWCCASLPWSRIRGCTCSHFLFSGLFSVSFVLHMTGVGNVTRNRSASAG
eukprot:SAG22_NODE_536_length_9364_cov_15.973988_15_plen_87_part_00